MLVPGALDEALVLLAQRRQVEAQDVAARVEVARIEQQAALAVVDAAPGCGSGVTRRRSSGATRSGLIENSSGDSASSPSAGALAGLHLQQLVGIDLDGVGIDRRRGGDGAGDDLALRQEALDARLDQALRGTG